MIDVYEQIVADESRWEREREGTLCGGGLSRCQVEIEESAVQRLRSPHDSQCTLNDHELPAIVK